MIFGCKEEFAIECSVDDNFGGEWVFGKVCYWVSGDAVGDFELGTSLRDVFNQMSYIVKDAGRRRVYSDLSTSAIEIFKRVDCALYEQENICESAMPDLDCPARFNVRIPVDVFDFWKIYLFEQGAVEVLCYKDERASEIKNAIFCAGTFDSVAAIFYNYLSSLVNKYSAS